MCLFLAVANVLYTSGYFSVIQHKPIIVCLKVLIVSSKTLIALTEIAIALVKVVIASLQMVIALTEVVIALVEALVALIKVVIALIKMLIALPEIAIAFVEMLAVLQTYFTDERAKYPENYSSGFFIGIIFVKRSAVFIVIFEIKIETHVKDPGNR